MNNLATAARFETTDRLNRYPRFIRDGKIAADLAIDDTEIWDAIATAFENGVLVREMIVRPQRRHGLGWRDVAAALERAIDSRSKACAKSPDDAALAERRAAVLAIADHVRPVADWFIGITDELHARTARAHPQAKAA